MKLDISMVTRVTEQCNKGCAYCSMQEKRNEYIRLETVENIITKVQNYNSVIAHFTWIGGEPLLMPDDFFYHITEFSNKNNPNNLQVSHSIQTNGLKLDSQRREFLQGIGFKIGISYDGTPALQSQLRRNRGRLPVVGSELRNLTNANKKVGTISVITKLSYGQEEKIYQELKKVSKTASLNLFAPIGEGRKCQTGLLPTKEQAKEMMIKFYELWRDDNDKFQLHPFIEIVKSFFTGRSNICEYSAISCYRILGINSQGDVYTCSRSIDIPETSMGNINRDQLEDILKSPSRQLILDRYFGLQNEGCKYFSICSGGCPIEASSTNGFMGKSYYCCEVKGGLFGKIEEDLNDDAIRKSLEARLFG